MNDITNNIKTLADRAMLVRLTRSRIRTSLRDKTLEEQVRNNTGDSSITVSKHLFRAKGSKVRQMLRAADEVYRLHMEKTLPWVDRGPRLIRNDQYMAYMQDIRAAIHQVDSLRQPIVADWGTLVQNDIRSRGGTASIDDYPTAQDVEQQMSFDVQILPLPDAADFRVDVDDATRRGLERALEEAEQVARRDVMQRMLEPMQRASEKLAVPIGEDGAIFRDSLLENMRAGVEQAQALNVSDDPELSTMIDEIQHQIDAVTASPQSLRTVQKARDEAKARIDDILARVG